VRARQASAAVVVAAAALLLPAGAAVGVDAPRPSPLDAARDQLGGASRELAEVEAAVRHANDEVAVLDGRLLAASTVLAQVRDELELAQASRDAALATERASALALARVDGELVDALAEWEAHRGRMQQRAVHAYKHGSTTAHDLLVRGIAGAGDWHEVTVALEVVGRLADDDRDLVAGSVTLTRSTAALRGEAGEVRTAALTAAREARAEEQRVAAIVARHEAIVTEIATERSRRAEILAALEADAGARAVLVRDLQRRVAELEFRAIRVFVPIDVDLDVHGPPPGWAARLPPAGLAYGAAIEATAARYGLDGRLLAALVWTESGFRPDVVSSAGAMGLAQLMPGTARGLGVDPRDPLQNLDGGARYLRTQLDRFGSVELALAAYNAGPGRVERAGNQVPNIVETQLYVVRVLERYQQLTA
jgi:soluble lytic murein transglycosylase-like protein